MTRPLIAILALVALLAAGCGSREDPGSAAGTKAERLDLMLDYFPNADHAGIYAAIGTGAFRAAKLDVRPHTPSDPAAPLKLLAAGRADLAISYEPEVLLARDRGLKVVSIGALVQVPLTSLMSLGDRAISDPSQLAGKRVGTAGIPYQDAYLDAILKKAGVDKDSVKRVNVGFNLVPAMLSKKVDATLGAFWNYEAVELRRRHKDPKVLRIEKLGVPTYDELVVVAREDDARNRGQLLRRFLLGLTRGHEALRRNPETGIHPLLEANHDLDPAVQRASVKATLPAFFPSEKGKPFGWQDPAAWSAYGRWMRENGLLKRPEDPQRALTNEFLPGEGPQAGDS